MADASGLALSSPGPEAGAVATVGSESKSGVGHDQLEDLCASIDPLVDTDKGHVESNVVEEDDPLAEFEAWIASGAVQIVEKL